MKRSVIRLAGKTFVVSLPSKWVKKHNVKKGQLLEVSEQQRMLCIGAPDQEKEKSSIKIDVSGLDDRVIRWIISAFHKKGFDEIKIKFNKKSTPSLIQELIKDLFIGFVVMEQTDNQINLKNVSKDAKDEFDSTLRRAFTVTLSMADSFLEFVEKKKFKELENLLTLEKTNNQLTNFCERILHTYGHSDFSKTCFLYAIIWNLEKICDEYKYLCNMLKNFKNPSLQNATCALIKETNGILRSYIDLMYHFNLKNMNGINQKVKEIRKKLTTGIHETKGEDSLVISHLYGVLIKCSDFSSSMIGLQTNQ